MPMEDADLIDAVFELSDRVRYAAVGRGQSVTTRQRSGLTDPTDQESDRYEELLVNPTLLTLVRQRGEIDCGGLGYVLIRYGSFFQLVVPISDGHLSVALEPHSDPVQIARSIVDLVS